MSILSSPFAGSIVMALDYKRLGNPMAPVISIVFTAIGTSIVVGLRSMVPSLCGGMNASISIGLALVMGCVALGRGSGFLLALRLRLKSLIAC